MISIGQTVKSKVLQLLTVPNGLNSSIAAVVQEQDVPITPIDAAYFYSENVASDIAEKATEPKYTAVYVYCEKISNVLNEKFRRFSGTIALTIEVRVSQDRLEGMDQLAQLYADAATQTLDQNRGDWGQGLFYSGEYEVSFGPVRHGGRNFIKSAKISLQVDASVS